jgi:hypothetical protein
MQRQLFAEHSPVTMPRIGFFRGKNGSALTWFVNPAKGFFMADSLKLSDFLHGIWNKRRKKHRGSRLPSDSSQTQ